MSERPTKRARGNYAKLICLRCRERRIKCQIPNDGSVEPSSSPQSPTKACQRCRQHGLECIVRKTTLGRPSQTRQHPLPTPPSTENHEQGHDPVSRSPSPQHEDLVLLTLDEDESVPLKRSATVSERPTSVQMISAITKTFDVISGLLARDPRFGSLVADLKEMTPLQFGDVVSEELAHLLDQQ